MRLTKYHRDAFIRSVMGEFPKEDLQEYKKKAQAIVLEEAIYCLPEEIREFYDKADFRPYIMAGMVAASNIFQLRDLPRNLQIFPSFEKIPGKFKLNGYGYIEGMTDLKLRPQALKEIEDLAKKYVEKQEKQRSLEQKLKEVTYSCSTLSSLQRALPSFKKHMPRDTDPVTDRSVPVLSNVDQEFIAAGWPKPAST